MPYEPDLNTHEKVENKYRGKKRKFQNIFVRNLQTREREGNVFMYSLKG